MYKRQHEPAVPAARETGAELGSALRAMQIRLGMSRGPEGATEADRERLDDEDLDRPYGR